MAKRTTKSAKQDAVRTEARIALLIGKEPFLQQEYTAELRQALENAHGELDVHRFLARETTPAEVLDECRSFGLIAAHKLIILDDAEELIKKEERAMFERYAESPSEGATLVIRSGSWRPGNLDKLIAKVGVIIKCDELKPHEAEAWLVRRAPQRHNAKIEPRAAAMLVDRVGVALARLESDLAKLALGCDNGLITEAQVDQMVAATRQLEPWPLQHALLSGSAERAIRYLRDTIETAPRGVEIPLIYSASTLARDLHACAVAHKMRIGIDQTASMLGKRNSWFIKDAYNAARRLNLAKTARLLDACCKADAQSKSGVGSPERSLEIVAVHFADAMR